ncbi:MAG: penicillin-binding protein 2 [Candidatus Omnitrophota bacterium]|nr:penicillin-binding protein 2 [Candidatus Omnitrophota bacterium]
MRLELFSKIICGIFLAVICGLFYTQIIRGAFYYELSQKNRIRLIPQDGVRGNILDRNGKVLADSRLSFAVSVIPQEVENKDEAFGLLAGMLRIEKSSLMKAYKNGYAAPFAPVLLKDNITKNEALFLEENKYRLGGIIVQVKAQRRYPYGQEFSHSIGYLREVDKSRITRLKEYGYSLKDVMGYDGVEEAFDRYLRAEKGGMQIEVNNKGQMVRLLGLRLPHKGSDVTLTINADMQRIAYSALAQTRGCIIVIDPYSGAILTMVSSPGYDPNVFAKNEKNEIKQLFNNSGSPMFNRVISAVYPPASLFKLITATAALENRKISASTTFFCDGKMTIGNREFKCWDKHGRVDFNKAVMYSCDIFFYQAGLLLGPQILSDYAFRFGLGRASGIDIEGEASGFVPTVNWKLWRRQESWFKGDTANFAIGQGDLLVTPLQMVRLISIFANGGYLIKPYLVESAAGNVSLDNRAGKKIGIKNEHLQILKQALSSTVSGLEGTAHILDMPGLRVAGKTGTAQVSRGLSHGWFIGFAPVNKPKIAFCVFIEHGGSSVVACTVARAMLERLLQENII